jgi:hypothetical protein
MRAKFAKQTRNAPTRLPPILPQVYSPQPAVTIATRPTCADCQEAYRRWLCVVSLLVDTRRLNVVYGWHTCAHYPFPLIQPCLRYCV